MPCTLWFVVKLNLNIYTGINSHHVEPHLLIAKIKTHTYRLKPDDDKTKP